MRAWTIVMVMAMVGEAKAQVSPSLVAECVKARGAGRPFQERPARLTLDPEPRFPAHSAVLTRYVDCGFRGRALVGARETWLLRVASGDLEGPGFDTGSSTMSQRYFLVCEGALRTRLPDFVAGLSLSWGAGSFTLPCVHHIYPHGSQNRSEASRVTGVNSFGVRDARLSVRDGVGPGDESFELDLDVEVVNPRDTLRLRGRVAGQLSGGLRAIECGDGPDYHKHMVHPACGSKPIAPAGPPPRPTPPPKPAPVSSGPLRWYRSCGDHVCSSGGYRGPYPGVPRCAGQAEGKPCKTDGDKCDLGNDCNMFLVCAATDPSTRCPR